MKKEIKKNIFVYVMTLPSAAVAGVRKYEKEMGNKYEILLLWDHRYPVSETTTGYDHLVTCDFSSPEKIANALLPYQGRLLAITCRGDANIARFSATIPHVPYLRTPSTESLMWAVDKYEMRKRLRLFDPKHTPKFTKVKDGTKPERKRVIEKIGFPMVIKPTNLAGSLFVSICYHEEELEQTLKQAFKKIKQAYENDKRLEEPRIIAEEYMEGLAYSIDSYVDSRGTVYHCPLVRDKKGKDIGHDDFYNYLQMTPTALKKESVERARAVTETAIRALGLRSVTAHTELMRIDDEWKVIEIQPRMGGFRDVLYGLSCDIEHSMNDLRIRIPKKPIIPKKCKGYAAAMKWFPDKEGRITEMKGIKKIEELESFHQSTINKKIGDRAVFARNGGRAVFTLFMYNKDRSKLLADIRRVEQLVEVKVQTRNGSTKAIATKEVVKKMVSKKVVKKK